MHELRSLNESTLPVHFVKQLRTTGMAQVFSTCANNNQIKIKSIPEITLKLVLILWLMHKDR